VIYASLRWIPVREKVGGFSASHLDHQTHFIGRRETGRCAWDSLCLLKHMHTCTQLRAAGDLAGVNFKFLLENEESESHGASYLRLGLSLPEGRLGATKV
jgi:hypothetical protein